MPIMFFRKRKEYGWHIEKSPSKNEPNKHAMPLCILLMPIANGLSSFFGIPSIKDIQHEESLSCIHIVNYNMGNL